MSTLEEKQILLQKLKAQKTALLHASSSDALSDVLQKANQLLENPPFPHSINPSATHEEETEISNQLAQMIDPIANDQPAKPKQDHFLINTTTETCSTPAYLDILIPPLATQQTESSKSPVVSPQPQTSKIPFKKNPTQYSILSNQLSDPLISQLNSDNQLSKIIETVNHSFNIKKKSQLSSKNNYLQHVISYSSTHSTRLTDCTFVDATRILASSALSDANPLNSIGFIYDIDTESSSSGFSRIYESKSGISALGASPNFSGIYGGLLSGQISIWDPRKPEISPIFTTKCSQSHTFPIIKVFFQKETLVAFSRDGYVTKWSLKSLNQPLESYYIPTPQAENSKFRSSTLSVWTVCPRDTYLRKFLCGTGENIHFEFQIGSNRPPSTVYFGPTSPITKIIPYKTTNSSSFNFLSSSFDGKLRLYNIAVPNPIATEQVSFNYLTSVCTINDTIYVSDADGKCFLYTISNSTFDLKTCVSVTGFDSLTGRQEIEPISVLNSKDDRLFVGSNKSIDIFRILE